MRMLSLDLRERIVAVYDRGGSTRQEVADRFAVSLGMVKKLLAQRERTGELGPRNHRCGRKPKIFKMHQRQLRALVRKQPLI